MRYLIQCKECPDFSVEAHCDAETNVDDVGPLAAKHRDEVHPGADIDTDPVYAIPVPE